jgi:AraC-like DNA-binding protein/Tfp pilus assembly protein PilF
MIRPLLAFILSIATFIAYGNQSGDAISNFRHLSLQQLFDTANYYYQKNNLDEALACYGLIIKTVPECADFEQQRKVIVAHNRSGIIHYHKGDFHTAYELYAKTLLLCEKFNYISYKARVYTNIGGIYFQFEKHDIAKKYYTKALNLSDDTTSIVILLNNIAAIELEVGSIDSALLYFNKALQISKNNNNTHLHSIQNNIALLERLVVERQLKGRTIFYQRIGLIVLLLVSGILLYVFFQKRKLDAAYKALIEKNLKIIDLQESSPKKYSRSTLSQDMQEGLLDKILVVMGNTSIICDTKFSIDKLAELVQSNHAYVSQVINDLLKKNFRSFLNDYRIQEAQRLFSEQNTTISSVALKVGFKSRSTFCDVFKEITGVTPNFYLKSIQEKAANL